MNFSNSLVGWMLLLNALIFLAVAVLMFVAVYLGIKFANRPPRSYKRCPFCAEYIRPEAIVCRYCRNGIDS